ncbi:ABC transporter substrate-binding protein [Arthrobacter sp. CAN_C5]|uniref:ABC transporter substrate-binding protein n=1 Tax=Arthrobacter sp. CAN_C5 TaxID=2760706 RepID=UPI001AE9ADA6|nr:ABC transporter substrate-binding protein [Arthrobacter sp. CAN_C5]MBP2215021.1 putative spermidine/putrescine transport system substrate-binding protein [Arthrobacter sp. CAN_C5]
MYPSFSPERRRFLLPAAAALALVLTGCSGASVEPAENFGTFDEVLAAAAGQTVDLWMFGGDAKGNAYVDDVLAPAAQDQGVTLRRVPIADTPDALNRVLSELQAGRSDGSVDLIWANGSTFSTGKQAQAWQCGWTDLLPNMRYTDQDDPLLLNDFGTPVDGCEAPWHKAQFTFFYNSDAITDPPTSLEGILEWARANPGRFTYPGPPDFTGSVFLREVMLSTAGGADQVPLPYSDEAFSEYAPAALQTLEELEPSLWREGATYPRDEQALNTLFADGEVDIAMTYGPATLTDLVGSGALPPSTKVLTLEEGTVGNASFLALPVNAADAAGAMVVANIALSPEQQAAKADPGTWGQFTVLDTDLLTPTQQNLFAQLPESPIVPDYEELSRNAHGELGSEWVPALNEAWRQDVASAP